MKKLRVTIFFLIMVFSLFTYLNVIPGYSLNIGQLRIVLKSPLKSFGADGGLYPIYLEIHNMDGEPVQLNHDVSVKLFSSDTRVASVPDEVVLPRGAFYKVFYVQTTYNPGTTEITALAPGFESGKLVLTSELTVGYPKRLAVYVYPESLIPSPSESAYIVVQLQDSMGKPSRAPSDITVNLYSSNPLVGSPTVTNIVIGKGHTYGFTTFKPTTIPGSTVITATAPGLESGSDMVTTIGPTPEMLMVEAAPNTLPANGRGSSYIYVTAYLVDKNGYPAWASEPIEVVFTSSNTSLAYFQSRSLVIEPGKFYVRNKLFVGGTDTGDVEVTVQAKGLVSARTVVSVKEPSNQTGGVLKLYVSPSVYPPGDLTYPDSVIVQVQDSKGNPIIANKVINVYLSSSSPIYGYPVENVTTIVKGVSLATADLRASKLVGSTTITASADNFRSSDANLEVKAPPPVNIKIGMGPRGIRATGDSYPFLYVQLQDEQGRPTTALEDIVVELSSSNEQFGNVPDEVVIPRGSSFTIVDFQSTNIQGLTNITASSTGFESDYIQVETIEPFPSILSAISYSNFIADGGTYPIYIQLLDVSGRPAKPELPIKISLVSSDPNIISVPSEVTLVEGAPYVTVNLSTSDIPGEVVISVAASGYKPTSLSIKSILLPMNLDVIADTNYILSNETLQFTVLASHKGLPLEQVELTLSSDNGDVTSSGVTRVDGTFTATYTPVNPGDDVIRIHGSKPGYEPIDIEYKLYVDKYVVVRVHAETVDGDSVEGIEVMVLDGGGVLHTGKTGSDGWVIMDNVKWGAIQVSVATNLSKSDTRYLFDGWSIGLSNTSTWNGTIVDDLTLSAIYKVEYLVQVSTEYGEVYGSGWYPKGTSVTIGAVETSVAINPLIYKKLVGWSGDVSSNQESLLLIVDSPKTITAVWVDDYFYLYIFIGVLGAVIGGSAGVYILYRKGIIFKREVPPEEEVSLEEYFMVEEERMERAREPEETLETPETEEVIEEAPKPEEEVEEKAPEAGKESGVEEAEVKEEEGAEAEEDNEESVEGED